MAHVDNILFANRLQCTLAVNNMHQCDVDMYGLNVHVHPGMDNYCSKDCHSAGLQLWLKGGGDTLAAGAAMAPAESEDPMSLKIERFGEFHLVTCQSSLVSIMLCCLCRKRMDSSCCLQCD